MESDAVLPQDQSNTNDVVISHEDTIPQLNGRTLSWTKLRRADSLDIESASIGGLRHEVVHISFTTYLFYFSLYMLLHEVVHILHILFCFFFSNYDRAALSGGRRCCSWRSRASEWCTAISGRRRCTSSRARSRMGSNTTTT